MSFILYLYGMVEYHVRRLHTYPMVVVFGAGCMIFLAFFLGLLIMFQVLASIGGASSKHEKDRRLAVIVPFRDRFEELLEFVPYMTAFLTAQRIKHDVFIVNQADEFRYASLSIMQSIKQSVNTDNESL